MERVDLNFNVGVTDENPEEPGWSFHFRVNRTSTSAVDGRPSQAADIPPSDVRMVKITPHVVTLSGYSAPDYSGAFWWQCCSPSPLISAGV